MRGRVVYKMTGSGNDFVMVDGRWSPVGDWTPEQIRTICARRTGLGADGLAVLEPGSEPGSVRFHFFNSDGSRCEMCGNASLCATRLAARLELAPPEGMVLETDAGAIRTRVVPGPGQLAEIGLPAVIDGGKPDIRLSPGETAVHLVKVGVPHLVVEILGQDPAKLDLATRGKELRSHPALPNGGANVNFVGGSDGKWKMRTYERGVEGETLACGTGAVAAAAALVHRGRAKLPLKIETASAKILQISGVATGETGQLLSNPSLIGEARTVYRAVLD